MNHNSARRRGQPVAVFAVLLLGWIGVRASLWESPLTLGVPPATERPGVRAHGAAAPATGGGETTAATAPLRSLAGGWHRVLSLPGTSQAGVRMPPAANFATGTSASAVPAAAEAAADSVPSIAEQRLLLSSVRPGLPGIADEGVKRWSLDTWAFVRGGAGRVRGGVISPVYGASQGGAALRYRLVPGSPHRPAAYLRATIAPGGAAEREAALGVAARPVASLPFAAQAEVRYYRAPGIAEFRPAVLVVSELAPLELPGGIAVETYAQAGYVGGRFATPFADGQARLTREVADIGPVSARLGGGAWGGAQRGAERIDIGPTATLDIPIAIGSARLALDYRWRLAGDAQPGSGLALTLSTGF